jgi:hypothetical protein
MSLLDPFSRTFLPLAAEAGVSIGALARHIRVLRRRTDPRDRTLLVARCSRLDRRCRGQHLLVLTRDRLVVTREARYLHRARLYLDQRVADLAAVTWSADPDSASVEFAVSTADRRERFSLCSTQLGHMWRLDAVLSQIFRGHAESGLISGHLATLVA